MKANLNIQERPKGVKPKPARDKGFASGLTLLWGASSPSLGRAATVVYVSVPNRLVVATAALWVALPD